MLPVSAAGASPALSTTAPAGSRDREGNGALHPAEERKRTRQVVARSVEMGSPVRRSLARRIVLAYADSHDVRADGWNAWLAHRFNPTQAAALENISGGGDRRASRA